MFTNNPEYLEPRFRSLRATIPDMRANLLLFQIHELLHTYVNVVRYFDESPWGRGGFFPPFYETRPPQVIEFEP
jgi:hypothetical protein